jgi:hypothetical protein
MPFGTQCRTPEMNRGNNAISFVESVKATRWFEAQLRYWVMPQLAGE